MELAWHFVGNTLRDGRPIPADGEWLTHEGAIRLCKSGLHASPRILDALQYAPGSTVCRVAVDGEIQRGDDKLAASRRVIFWRLGAAAILQAFARSAALSVIHLWDARAIVREYLETGDESLRRAARTGAWAAVNASDEWVAANAAKAAANAAEGAAARAVRDAARAAARDAANAGARAAAMQKFDAELEAMIRAAAGNPGGGQPKRRCDPFDPPPNPQRERDMSTQIIDGQIEDVS